MSAPWVHADWKPSPDTRSTIVFVHGAIVNGWEMALLRHRCRQLGYHTRQFHYHSMLCGLDENVQALKAFLSQTEADVLHVVGHSMGGVLTRHVFEKMPDPRPGRLIAIGSPFLDCWVAHRYARLKSYIGLELAGRTVKDHIKGPLDPFWRGMRDFGVIAGTYPLGAGTIFHDLPKVNDGVVLWDETRLHGITDHVTYRINHFGMLLSKRCTAQVARFLATGIFVQPDSVPISPAEEKLTSAAT